MMLGSFRLLLNFAGIPLQCGQTAGALRSVNPDLILWCALIDTAIATSLESASEKTATVEVQLLGTAEGKIVADVKITNLAGHSFPSGVGFRRAFVDFQVLDESGKVLWESGGTNDDGVITDGRGFPLTTEFFTSFQQRYQKHYWVDNPIRREDEVQIYEELVASPEGFLTTSFIALDH